MKLSLLIDIVKGKIFQIQFAWFEGPGPTSTSFFIYQHKQLSKTKHDEFVVFHSLEGVHWSNQTIKYVKNYLQITFYCQFIKIIKGAVSSFQ